MTVAIFDADVPTGIAFVRSLGRAGVPLRVYSHRRWPVSRFSRYCADFARCPDLEDPRFLPWLDTELRSGRIDLVAPTSDLIAFACAELEGSEAVLACLFKDRFDAACARLGFRTPWSAHPRSIEEACDLAAAHRYPAILKPKSHVGVGIARGEIVQSPDELRMNFRPYPLAETRYPELALPMVQELVPLAVDNLYSVSGVLGPGGEALAASCSRKIAQWPQPLGIGIEFHPVDDPALLDLGVSLARGILGGGLFEVEFIRDPRSGDWLAIDLNPRAHGFIRFDIERGHDLPLLWYRSATGEAMQPCGPARQDLYWRHGVPHAVHRFTQPHAKPALRHVDIVHDWSDPLPSIPFLALMLRHPGGLVRPFLAANDHSSRMAPAMEPVS